MRIEEILDVEDENSEGGGEGAGGETGGVEGPREETTGVGGVEGAEGVGERSDSSCRLPSN